MSVLRLEDGRLWVHSPAPIDAPLKCRIAEIGPVGFIVAPGDFHYLNVAAWQAEFPKATTFVCPGVERKRPGLRFEALLDDEPPIAWAGELDQASIRGARLIREVAFFDKRSKTLILVDSIENIGDRTPNINWVLKAWWRVLGMWNRPLPAPEYRFSWNDRGAARSAFERILSWDFERIVLAHGDLIEADAREVARRAWSALLTDG